MIRVKATDMVIGVSLLLLYGAFYFFSGTSFLGKSISTNSTVAGLYRDYSEHGQGTILMSDGTKLPVGDAFYYKIKIGDSISKRKNDPILKVVRQDSVFYFNLDDIVPTH